MLTKLALTASTLGSSETLIVVIWPPTSRVAPLPTRVSTKRNGVTGSNRPALVAAVVSTGSGAGGGGCTARGASRSTLKDQSALPPFDDTLTEYVPSARGSRGITTTALSPSRIALPVLSATLPLCSTHVAIGPLGPLSEALAEVTSVGIMAINGSPALPVQPHIVRGFGNSVTNECSGTVERFPGKTVGVDGRGVESSPRSTSSVPPERHGLVLEL